LYEIDLFDIDTPVDTIQAFASKFTPRPGMKDKVRMSKDKWFGMKDKVCMPRDEWFEFLQVHSHELEPDPEPDEAISERQNRARRHFAD
jgi:hypothetical protein